MASCGESVKESKKNLKEVISINFVERRKMDTSMNYCKMPDLLKTRCVLLARKELVSVSPLEVGI